MLGLIALLGWFALIVQYKLMFDNRQTSLIEMNIRFFSYFTILTNALVTIYCTLLLFKTPTRWERFFSRPTVTTAVTLYIAVVGFIYNIILRFLWSPTGMQRVVDELLHSIIPLAFVGYWFFFTPTKTLQWKSFLPWLIYPSCYCLFILVRGSFSAFYPYPFMEVNTLGLNQVLLNSLGLTGLFFAFSLLFIGIGKLKNNDK